MKDNILFTVYRTDTGIEVRLGKSEIDALALLGTLELLKRDIIDNMSQNAVVSDQELMTNKSKYDA